MLGNVTYSGHAVDLATVCAEVPCCQMCFKFNFFKVCFTDQTTFSNCENCVQQNTGCQDGKLDFDPPPHYPHDELPFGLILMLRPLRIT